MQLAYLSVSIKHKHNLNMLKVILTTLFLLLRVTKQNVISTTQGRIRGVSHDGYISYLGIPYATVTDNGRFKKAGLAPLWSGIRESHEAHCSMTSDIQECLLLDVHVPTSLSSQWPVLVWVTGGSGQYNARQLVLTGIIVVVVHHRIGPLGFLCLKERSIPGNTAAKDVVLALRWVRDNIVAFKGNPSKIILAGQSFGAAIVEAVTLSPMSFNLYEGVILQSGSAISPWAFNYDAKERAEKLAHMIADSYNTTNILLQARLEELVDKSNKLHVPYIPLGMCVENSFKNEETLLPEATYDLLSKRMFQKVPMIIGYNSDEAYIFASMLKEAQVLRAMATGISFLIPAELKFFNERELKQVTRQVNDMYFKGNVTMSSLMVYHRDAYFVNHIHRSVLLHASTQPVYYYQFSYANDIGVQEEPGIKKSGAAHSDELAYLFSGRIMDGDDRIVQDNLLKLWSNFVKHLNPMYGESTDWNKVDPENPRVLEIGTELKMIEYPSMKSATLWNDIYDKYYYSKNRG